MKHHTLSFLISLLLLPLLGLTTGCFENKDGSPSDILRGNNNAASQASGNTPATDNNEAADSDGNSRVLAFGDSITAGWGVSESYAPKLSRILGREVVQSGVSGEQTNRGLQRLAGVLDSVQPAVLVLLEGTNDANRDLDAGAAVANLMAMVDLARARGIQVIIGTLPPLRGPSAALQGKIQAINNGIRSQAGAHGASVANIAGEFGGGESLIQADGVHPNDNGQAVIAVTFSERF